MKLPSGQGFLLETAMRLSAGPNARAVKRTLQPHFTSGHLPALRSSHVLRSLPLFSRVPAIQKSWAFLLVPNQKNERVRAAARLEPLHSLLIPAFVALLWSEPSFDASNYHFYSQIYKYFKCIQFNTKYKKKGIIIFELN